MNKITKRLRDLREDSDTTQKEIADILGMKYQQYQNYESGKRSLPIQHIEPLCNYYNVSADYILGITDNPTPHEKRLCNKHSPK